MSVRTELPEWVALQEHKEMMDSIHMRDLFANDPERFSRFTLRFDDFLLDYSKNRIQAETMDLLVNLARAAGRRSRAYLHFQRCR